MSAFIEEFYYGNIEPQECTTELKEKVVKCLNGLVIKKKNLMNTLTDDDKELFADYVNTYIKFLSICNADKTPLNRIFKATVASFRENFLKFSL